MAALIQTDIDAIADRHPAVFAGSRRKQATSWLIGLGVVAYLVFAWWFFAVGSVLANGNWGIAGIYLADWVSYETRPNIEFTDEGLEIRYPRFSAYNDERHPGWITLEDVRAPGVAGRIAMTVGDGSVEVAPGEVIARRGPETLAIIISPDEKVTADGPLPSWAEQDALGDSITLGFGFRGSVEIEGDEIKVRQRFWGWENFVFDANSPFWGKSFGEVVSLVFSGDRIKPEMSNAALAWNNILNNAEWQHGDVWLKLGQTIVMAFVGTVFASLLAFPLAFAAARNITRAASSTRSPSGCSTSCARSTC